MARTRGNLALQDAPEPNPFVMEERLNNIEETVRSVETGIRRELDGLRTDMGDLNQKVESMGTRLEQVIPDYLNAKSWRKIGQEIVKAVAVMLVTGFIANLLGCDIPPISPPPITPTPTEDATAIPPSATAAPSQELTAEASPTATLAPSPTVTQPPIPVLGPNRLNNPGFEGGWRWVGFPEISVYDGWQPFYCDEPYTEDRCQARRLNAGNPPDLYMRRPEFKPSGVTERVHGGITAQQWFCMWGACDAGVYQTVATTPGATCELTAYVQTWSADGAYGTDGVAYHSDVLTLDQRDNSVWYLRVDLDGGRDAFLPGLPEQQFGYEAGHYDQYTQIVYEFTATGPQTTVFIGNYRLWPITHNDSYVDDVSLRCYGDPPPAPTPAPSPTPQPPGPLPTPDASIGCNAFPCPHKAEDAAYTVYTQNQQRLRLRDGYSTVGTSIIGSYAYGETILINCVMEIGNGDFWASPDPCEPEPRRWVALEVGGTRFLMEPDGVGGGSE